MNWKSPCRPSGTSCHKNISTRLWRTSPNTWLPTWWSLWASVTNLTKHLTTYVMVTLSICDEPHQALDYLLGGHSEHLWRTSPNTWLPTWWSLWASAATLHLQDCIVISSPTNQILSQLPTGYWWRQCMECCWFDSLSWFNSSVCI